MIVDRNRFGDSEIKSCKQCDADYILNIIKIYVRRAWK